MGWWSSGDGVKPVGWSRIPPRLMGMVCLSRERGRYGYSGYKGIRVWWMVLNGYLVMVALYAVRGERETRRIDSCMG